MYACVYVCMYVCIKGRDAAKGMLLIGGSPTDFHAALEELAPGIKAQVLASWPGHVTWLLPVDACPQSVKGQHSTIACRVPDHAQARDIVTAFGGPIVSTSLNRAGEPAVQSHAQAAAQFEGVVDMVVRGETSGYVGASAIIGLDGAVIREASE